MCGRFVQYSDPEVYASRFDLDEVCKAEPRYNVAPTQSVLAIRPSKSGGRELVPMRWGLIPSWSKGPDSRYSMINARAETIHAKPAYRSAFKNRRCLIPAEGFYEWQKTGKGKQPHLIRRRDQAPFAMAGLWETWRDGDGKTIESCTIIVTEANAVIRPVHDRMPAILATEDFTAWLDPKNGDNESLTGLLRPAPPGDLTLEPVSKLVNSPRNEGAQLLEPLSPETDRPPA
jgi:putative SOS response-associated peptidase YedK